MTWCFSCLASRPCARQALRRRRAPRGEGCAERQRDQRDSRNHRSRRVGLHVDQAHGRRDANGRRSLHDAVRPYPIGAQETPGQMGAGSRCEYADSSHFLAFRISRGRCQGSTSDNRWYMLERGSKYSPTSRMHCRDCSSEECHRATRHGWQDFLFRLVGMFPWRCNRCGARFYRRQRSDR